MTFKCVSFHCSRWIAGRLWQFGNSREWWPCHIIGASIGITTFHRQLHAPRNWRSHCANNVQRRNCARCVSVIHSSIQLDRFPRFYCSKNPTALRIRFGESQRHHVLLTTATVSRRIRSDLFLFLLCVARVRTFLSNRVHSTNSMAEHYVSRFPLKRVKRFEPTPWNANALATSAAARRKPQELKWEVDARWRLTFHFSFAASTHTPSHTHGNLLSFSWSEDSDSVDAPSVSFSRPQAQGAFTNR